MPFDISHARPLLQNGDFCRLFIEELGWEPCARKFMLRAGDCVFPFDRIAEKRGFTVWVCESPDSDLPDHTTRLKIDRALTQTSFEHLIIFANAGRVRQEWMWVRRESGKPLRVRTHKYTRGQPGDSLLQKLQLLYISLEEEERGELSTLAISGRARSAFDIEIVTKAFYRDFDAHRKAFLKFISGIEDVADREWYASVMLNRLMFVYFIQRKGFLDGDHDYLRNRLDRCREEKGKDKFYSFYRYFLLRLFHEGFGQRPGQRAAGLEKLLGHIPYLNGGIFDVHELEKPTRYGNLIQIPDNAFERIFDYFDQYQWHLDERPLRADNEINPDVLGYIFEKYINQKQMGAYYTKEDITEYISKNTVLPFLFESAQAKCKVAFENPSGPTVWDLLSENPDRYIYAAVRHGMSWDIYANDGKGGCLDTPHALPPEIAEGVDATKPDLIERRKAWNKSAPASHALPTEIWREVVARRNRYEEISRKLAAGEVHGINDFITLNLDIRQFAQDVIANCEGPDLLRALWHSVERITILDPTCGSGAFLFAALNILEPLYEACLDRMEIFLRDEADKVPAESQRSSPAGNPILPRKKFEDFTHILDRVASHPNRRYFIFKSIILNNLYGVDIMEEAVEICKLRLFLKLAAQVAPDSAKDNLGIEPLPDIDFNIRAGNTLVGYATYDEVKKAVSSAFDFDNAMEKISVKAADLQQTFDAFRQRQTEGDGSVPLEHKLELQKRLKSLEDELNRHLAGEYGIKLGNKTASTAWIKSHRPFHWFIEFYGILSGGGFSVIIGNPPYVELSSLVGYKLRGYSCEDSGNLYAVVMERCASLCGADGRQGFIVPVSSVSTDRYESLQRMLLKRENHFSSYDDRPSRLFDGLEHIRLTIHLIGRAVDTPQLFSTRYNKWMADERPTLFGKLRFTDTSPIIVDGTLPKLSSELEKSIIQKMIGQHRKLCSFYSRTGKHEVLYSRKVGYFLQVLDFEPRVFDGRGHRRPPSEFKNLDFGNEKYAQLALCCLNANLFYWFVTTFSDCRHVNKREVDAFPIDLEALAASESQKQLVKLAHALMLDLQEHSESRIMHFAHDTLTVQCIYPKLSKSILDEIDRVLAQHYGFTEEELDFILNYDIKYRLGRDAESEEE
jgi:hypothetical protein